MALHGLKGGGYVTYKHLEAIGVSPEQSKDMTKEQIQEIADKKNVKVPVFATWQEADAYLNSPEFHATLTPDDKQAISGYTGNSYYAQLNKAIYNESQHGIAPDAKFQDIIQKTDAALAKFPKYSGEVYRKVTISNLDAFMKGYAEGDTVTFPAYSSSSTTKGTWSGNVQYTIKTNGKKASPIFKHSQFPNEHEVLFGRNSQFRVKKVTPEYTDTFEHKVVGTKPKYNVLKSGKLGKKVVGTLPVYEQIATGKKISNVHIELEEI